MGRVENVRQQIVIGGRGWMLCMRAALLVMSLTLGPLARAQNAASADRSDTKTAQKKSTRPRQIFLEARVVIMDPCGLRELGNWDQMTLRADEASLSSKDGQCATTTRMPGVQMHRAPDSASTESLLAALYDLENGKQLQFVKNSQFVAQDGRETLLNFLCEEWFFFVDEDKRDSARRVELARAMLWPKIWITPRLSSHNDLVLEARFGLPDDPAAKRKNIRTAEVPRTERVSVTICNNGTAAWAGLAPPPKKKARVSRLGRIPLIGAFFRSTKADQHQEVVVVFLMASLIPEERLPARPFRPPTPGGSPHAVRHR